MDMILLKRHGRYGKFIACENYPECKYIKKEKVEPEFTGENCPKCGSPMVLKPEDMVNLKHVQIIHNVNILRILKRKQNLL